MNKSLYTKVISSLGLIVSLAACGDNHTATVPRDLPQKPDPTNVVAPDGALSVTGPTIVAGPAGEQLPASLDLKALNNTSWVSTCYRFSSSGDYNKKYWSFTEGSMNSLVLKFKDEACTDLVPATARRLYGVWNISSITLSPSVDDWSIVLAKCTSGNCSANIDMAMRVKGTELHEGNKDPKSGNYYIEEGRHLRFTKQPADLNKIAADSNGNVSTPSTPTTRPVTEPVSTADASGLAGLADLAGKNYGVCVPDRADASGVIKSSSKKTLSFSKGADLAKDSYATTNVKYQTADCTGEGVSSTPWTFTNLLVKDSEQAGWILVEGRACSGDGCNPQKALLKLTTTGFLHAGEKGANSGNFYIETPRDYILIP